MRRTRHRHLVCLLILALLVPCAASAQWTYHNFVFDKTFRIGGISADSDTIARELKLDFIQHYHDTDSLDSTKRALFRRFLNAGLRVVYPPDRIDGIARNTLALDNYVGWNTNIQVFGFETGNVPTQTSALTLNNLFWGKTIAAVTPASDTLVVSGPERLTPYVLKRNNPGFYTQLGLPDMSQWFQISVAMRAGDIDPLWAQDTTLLYMVLYRRNRTGQADTCKCNIFSPFDTLRVTKST